jgi:hypothetical protein
MSDTQYIPPPPPPPALPPPPPTGRPPAGSSSPQFDFAKPFTYVFEDPRWMQKILMGGLFYLAGFLLIGWFFIFGYVAQVTRNIIAGVERPLPEWEDLGGFFNEGARLFGVLMVYILPLIALFLCFMIPAGILGAFENEPMQALGSGVAGCLSCLMVPISIAMMFFIPASLLFAVVEQRFSAAFEFSRIWTFIRANVGNYLLAVVVYLIARFLGGFGVALLCIGVIFTGFWSFLITAHGFAQVYRLSTTPHP